MTGFGLLQVYTGDGKGKTTASIGLALRACGHGFKVCMVQFMKETGIYGEERLKAELPNLTILPVGRNDFVNLKSPEEIDIRMAREGWEKAKQIIRSGEYQIVILDELNVAMSCSLLPQEDVLAFLREKHDGVEIVTTGRWAPQALIELADLVTEMREIRHPFAQGIESREGIDH